MLTVKPIHNHKSNHHYPPLIREINWKRQWAVAEMADAYGRALNLDSLHVRRQQQCKTLFDKIVHNTEHCLSPVHTGNKVDSIGNKVDRNKMSNSRCCRFVAKTGNKVVCIRQQSTLLPICCRFRQQSTFNKVDRVEFNFVAGVYQALTLLAAY